MELDEEVVFLINAYRAAAKNGMKTKIEKANFRARMKMLATVDKQISGEAVQIMSAIYGIDCDETPGKTGKIMLSLNKPLSTGANPAFNITEETDGDGCHAGTRRATRKTLLALRDYLNDQFDDDGNFILRTKGMSKQLRESKTVASSDCGHSAPTRGC